MQNFYSFTRILLALLQNISTWPLTVRLLACRLELMLCLCGCSSSNITCASPSQPRALPGLSGVIPWKGMTEPQCLEMTALAAISSSKKRAH